MSILDTWANAIQAAEGWYVGSRSYRNNNPGNISYAAAVEWSMTGLVGGDGGTPNLAIFDNYNDGYAGLELYITKACSGTWALYPAGETLLQFTNTYANPTSMAYVNSVATALGVDTNTVISTILPGTPSTQAAPIPDLLPENLTVSSGIITLGVDANHVPAKFVVQQNSYNRTWSRYTNSNGILGSGGSYINMIDSGPGTNQFDFTIVCRDWDPSSPVVAAGVPATWAQQKINIETLYGQVGSSHTYIDPFGQQPHQGPYPGVYITKLSETIDVSSTSDSPCSYFAITLLQAPPGVQIDNPTSQAIPPPVSSNLLAIPIITLGKADASNYNFFAIQQGQYTRTWSRYNSSQAIPGSPLYATFVDYGPGINEYDLRIICRTWPVGSLPYEYGVTQSWAQQKASLENMYNSTNTLHVFLDPFGQYPTQDSTKGVYITKFAESIDPSSTPNDPCTYYDITCLQTPPGPTIGTS